MENIYSHIKPPSHKEKDKILEYKQKLSNEITSFFSKDFSEIEKEPDEKLEWLFEALHYLEIDFNDFFSSIPEFKERLYEVAFIAEQVVKQTSDGVTSETLSQTLSLLSKDRHALFEDPAKIPSGKKDLKENVNVMLNQIRLGNKR